MPSGYSGTPLAKKLGIKPGHRVAVLDEPPELQALLAGSLPDDVDFQVGLVPGPDVAIAFFTEHARLQQSLDALADAVFPDRAIWIAWPKRASGLPTDLSGDAVRAIVLATKLVDVKICAISEVWSGPKVVWRTEHRK